MKATNIETLSPDALQARVTDLERQLAECLNESKSTGRITADDVLNAFNVYNDGNSADDMDGAISVNSARRESFNDIIVELIYDEGRESIREWDKKKWGDFSSFCKNFNEFLKMLDDYYYQRKDKYRNRK